MKKIAILACMCGGAIALSGCGGKMSEDEKFAVIEDFATGSSDYDSVGGLYEDITFQIFQQLVSGSVADPERMGPWEDEDFVKQQVSAGYADYIDKVEENLIGGISQRMQPEEVAILAGFREDEAKRATLDCIFDSSGEEWGPKWAECETQDAGKLSDEEKAAYEKFADSFAEVIAEDTSLTYFGGTTCRLIDRFAQDVSNDRYTLSFSEMKLNLGGPEQVPCEELRDRLVDLRTSQNPGVLIER